MKPLPVYDSADYCPGCGRDEGADGQDAAHGSAGGIFLSQSQISIILS